VFCVAVTSSSSVEMRASCEATDVDEVDSAATTHTVCSTGTSHMQMGTAADNAAPSETSSVSVMVGRTEGVSADSDVVSQTKVQCAVTASVGPQIATAGNSSLIQTASYSPLTVETVSEDRPSADGLSANNRTERSVTERFVVCVCLWPDLVT